MDEFVEFGIRIHRIRGLPRNPGIGQITAVLQREAYPVVIYAGSVVNQLVAGFLVVPRLDWIDPKLELQSRGDAIHGLIGGGLIAVGVGVQIDETGRGHEAFCLNGALARERLC